MISALNETYEIKSIIGKGGMSTVYLAEHKRLHTLWAVKEVIKNPSSPVDFLAESKMLKKLNHPALPQIIDIFEDDERVIIVEDFVEGMSLKDYIKNNKRVDEAQGLKWFHEMCMVLKYLHSQKPNPIIYRDMKPANIMLKPDNTLKLIDFGIAREYKHDSSADTTYIGTKGYAAPEQFGKAQTDARTDIYSLGITMYHLLSGKSPYEPPYQFVPIRQLVPELSHGIEYILNKCVQPEPENRYQNVDELIYDLTHIYRFDVSYKKAKRAKHLKACGIALMFVVSLGLILGGLFTLNNEKEAKYVELLNTSNSLLSTDYNSALDVINQARDLYPDRVDTYRQQIYGLYINGEWQQCIDEGEKALQKFSGDTQIRVTMSCAQFELGDYINAAIGFEAGEDLSVDNMRDYAVCLGRLGKVDEGEKVLAQMIENGADSVATEYVHGEMCAAKEDYIGAENSFNTALVNADTPAMKRRCYTALGNMYQKCAVLARVDSSPILNPATKSVSVLSQAVVEDALRFDSTIWEMLAMAYFESYHTDPSVDSKYLIKAAECFDRVIELGVTKDYLYTNLYTIYYELKDYAKAEDSLARFEQMYPDAYTPHALRAMMLITIENGKNQSDRNYSVAEAEYKVAGDMIRSSDDATYYQQLDTLIQNLRKNGWL